jgi:hypothetical protein
LRLSPGARGNGQPELTCKKGPFQGYDIWLRRPGQEPGHIGFSLSRNYREPPPAPGTAEIWTFEVQYQNASFGRKSQPVSLTVRG